MRILELEAYDVDPRRGFLPEQDPLQRLPPPFAGWDQLAANLPALILTGQVRHQLAQLHTPDLHLLEDGRQLERAMLIISALGMAYVWGQEPAITRLPTALARPWQQLAAIIGRPPIITHASIVLNNWRRLDPDGPLTLANLACVQHFLGGLDEQWFFTITVALEAAGAPALQPLLEVNQAAAVQNNEEIICRLNLISSTLTQVLNILKRIYEKCDPYIFYHRIRPFLTGWESEGLVYEGVSDTPLKLHGGSAAQSSLIQAFDAGLGIEHLHSQTRPFLRLMRDYMPPKHRQFIEDLAAISSLHEYVQKKRLEAPALGVAYNVCIDRLDAIRQAHMAIAVRYISQQVPEGEVARGTGGTSFVPFLSKARQETKEYRLPRD